jgi:hypothetical protein
VCGKIENKCIGFEDGSDIFGHIGTGVVWGRSFLASKFFIILVSIGLLDASKLSTVIPSITKGKFYSKSTDYPTSDSNYSTATTTASKTNYTKSRENP